MSTADLAWVFLAAALCAMVVAQFANERVPVVASVAAAAIVRIGFAALTSVRFTPADSRRYFRESGILIENGRDPLHDLPAREWNFLDLMPAVHALELHSGLPWVYAVKIAPIAADLVLVCLVAKIAPWQPRTRALQYALNPVSLLVVSLHGQVEPIALAFSLGGILAIRAASPRLGGLLLGAAVAAKTWPVVVLLAVLPIRDRKRTGAIVLGALIVPVLCVLSGVLFLDTQPIPDVHKMLTYSSYVLNWTWSGLIVGLGHTGAAGYNSTLAPIGSALIALGVVAALVVLRSRPAEVRALGCLCAVLIGTAGFGNQYLLWVVPLAMALSGPWRVGYVAAATAWAGIAYLHPFPDPRAELDYLRALSWAPASALAALLVEQMRRGSFDAGHWVRPSSE